MKVLDLIIILYSYAFSGLLIYLIERGLTKRYQLLSAGIAVLIFLCDWYFSHPGPFSNLNYGFLSLPVIVILAINLAGLLSWKWSGREFRATWRGARYYYGREKNWVDYLLSFVIIMTELGWPFVIAFVRKGSV